MLIANPIYDVVFKYLLDDEKVAKLLLSALLGQTVEDLQYRAMEHRIKLRSANLIVLRMDFQAKIRLEDGTWKLVLIEIQKARSTWDLERFRRYLGSQYADIRNNYVDIKGKKHPLPIISVYFLGENLEHTDASVVRVGRYYRDGVTGEEIRTPERFIESLTHDSIVVQIPRLKDRRRNELEQLLSIFDQDRIQENQHQMTILEEEVPERYRDVIRRLQRAMAEPKIEEEMTAEDEILQVLLDKDRAVENLSKALEEKDKALEEERRIAAEKEEAFEEERRASEAKDKAIEAKDQALQEQMRLIEELRLKLGMPT